MFSVSAKCSTTIKVLPRPSTPSPLPPPEFFCKGKLLMDFHVTILEFFTK